MGVGDGDWATLRPSLSFRGGWRQQWGGYHAHEFYMAADVADVAACLVHWLRLYVRDRRVVAPITDPDESVMIYFKF